MKDEVEQGEVEDPGVCGIGSISCKALSLDVLSPSARDG